jgi:sphingolipid 4-desaturase/C4-monooxygenase
MAAQIDFSLFGGAESFPPTAVNASCASSDCSSVAQLSDDESVAAHLVHGRPQAQWQPQKVPVDPNDWLWVHTEEPHRSRRKAILAAHPEVRNVLPSALVGCTAGSAP